MRTLPTATANYLSAYGDSVVAGLLFWFTARERVTFSPVTLGLWTGADDYTFTVDGSARDYYGAGAAVGIDPIRRFVGTEIQMQQITLGILTDEANQLLRAYEPRQATVEVHRAFFHPATRALLAGPDLEWEGTVEEVDISTPAADGAASCTLRCSGGARGLHLPLELYRSDEAFRKVRPGDRVFRYATLSGAHGRDDSWGSKNPD